MKDGVDVDGLVASAAASLLGAAEDDGIGVGVGVGVGRGRWRALFCVVDDEGDGVDAAVDAAVDADADADADGTAAAGSEGGARKGLAVVGVGPPT